MERYQNFSCSIDSIGSLQSISAAATITSPPASASRATPTTAPIAVAPIGTLANAGEPRIGMTSVEVKAIWGEPMETDQDEPKEGRVEIWRYADGRSVQFNNKHRVLAVQR